MSDTPPRSAAGTSGPQSVRRALTLLQHFVENGPHLSASDLARWSGLALSTTHRLARALTEAGLLEQDATDLRYRLGPAITELGTLSYQQRGLHLVHPELDALARHTGAAADLACRDRNHVLVVAGTSLLPQRMPGLRRPLHSTALGKVLLAWSPPGDLTTLAPMQRLTPRTIVDPADLAAELTQVREDGYAVNDEESALGVRTLAVPILDAASHARYALAIRATPELISTRRLDELRERTQACARALAVHLLPELRATTPRRI